MTGENPFDYIGVKGEKTNAGDALDDTENMNDAAVNEDNAYEDAADQDAENEDTENTDVKNDESENDYGSQSGADKRTDAQNSKTRLHIPPVILKTSLCVIFLTALTAIIVYIKRRRNIL